MRYPLWAFFFVFLLPPFAAHALLTGSARLDAQPNSNFSVTTVAHNAPQTFHSF